MSLDIERFCRNVRQLRVRSNLSIKEMAAILDLSEENLRLLESGTLTDEMDVRIVYNIYFCFGIQPNKLFEEM